MQDSAIVPTLVPARATFLLEYKQLGGWKSLKKSVSRSKSDDPTTNDRDFHSGYGQDGNLRCLPQGWNPCRSKGGHTESDLRDNV